MTEFAAESQVDLLQLTTVELSQDAVDYDLLHSAVGATILNSHFGPTKLPGHADRFDWSLGQARIG